MATWLQWLLAMTTAATFSARGATDDDPLPPAAGAVLQGDLQGAPSGPGPLTVFAPTRAAVDAIEPIVTTGVRANNGASMLSASC